MDNFFFDQQFERLKLRFGRHVMDHDTKSVVRCAVENMTDRAFKVTIDNFIEGRPHTSPPRAEDFIEAAKFSFDDLFDLRTKTIAKNWAGK